MTTNTLDRIRHLPRRDSEVWQGDQFELPALFQSESGGEPYQPQIVAWVAIDDDRCGSIADVQPEDSTIDAQVEAMVCFATDETCGGYLPGHLEVRDAQLATRLRELLGDIGIAVECKPHLAHFDRVMTSVTETLVHHVAAPGLLDADGVTLEMVRRFADAMVAFHRAEPWRELTNLDLIRVESPTPPKGLAHAIVLGEGGREYGLAFYGDPEDLWTQMRSPDRKKWLEACRDGVGSLTFDRMVEIPPVDAVLWETYGLPLARPDAYPQPLLFKAATETRRPNASELVFMEGLARVLAATTGEEFDRGRWSKSVETAQGRLEFTLALPDLLDPPDHVECMRRGIEPDPRAMERAHFEIQRFLDTRKLESIDDMNRALTERFNNRRFDEDSLPPRNPLEEAQLLCFEAFDAIGRRRRLLAGRALDVCADCTDAYVLLAEESDDLDEALNFCTAGVAAGERVLGPDRLAEDAGKLWRFNEARPYLRARFELAERLDLVEEVDEAIEHYRAIIDLDEDDHLGARYALLVLLLEEELDADADALLRRYRRDPDPLWMYGAAFVAYRTGGGDSPRARTKLREAIRLYPLVVDELLGDRTAPLSESASESYEAQQCAEDLYGVVLETPGMAEWLARCRDAEASRKKPRPSRPTKRRKRKK